MQALTKHINGAVALMHLRGIEQLQCEIGRNIFIQLRLQVVSWARLLAEQQLT